MTTSTAPSPLCRASRLHRPLPLYVGGDNRRPTTSCGAFLRRRRRTRGTPLPLAPPPPPLRRLLLPPISARCPRNHRRPFMGTVTAVRGSARAMMGTAMSAGGGEGLLLKRDRPPVPCRAAATQRGHRWRREKRQGGPDRCSKAGACGLRQVRAVEIHRSDIFS